MNCEKLCRESRSYCTNKSQPMTFTFTTRHWIINTKEHRKKKKINEVHFLCWQYIYILFHEVVLPFCSLYFSFFSFFFISECRRHHRRSRRRFINSVLFVWLFHEEFFLSFIFHSLSLVISFFYLTLGLTLFARHFTEIPNKHFCHAADDNNNSGSRNSDSDNTITLRCAKFDSYNILFSFHKTAPPKKLDHNLTAIATSKTYMKSWIVDMK